MTRIKTVRERTSVPSQLAGIVAVVVPPLGLVGARRAGAGAVVICALLPAVAATAAASTRVDRPAGLLYTPYLAWSTYAAALNLEIWRRNRS